MSKVELASIASAIDGAALNDADKNEVLTRVMATVAPTPLPDTWIYRIVVIALGLAIFVPLLAMLVGDTEAEDSTLAQLVLPIATTALGALAGLLAPSPAQS